MSYVAELTGKNCERFILGFSVFTLGRYILIPNIEKCNSAWYNRYFLLFRVMIYMLPLGDIAGAASTYSRFFPVIKQRYDYGVVIFILTFSLIAISGYRTENLFQMMHQRIATIVIGCALCFLINIFPFPIWAGDDLHSSVIQQIIRPLIRVLYIFSFFLNTIRFCACRMRHKILHGDRRSRIGGRHGRKRV